MLDHDIDDMEKTLKCLDRRQDIITFNKLRSCAHRVVNARRNEQGAYDIDGMLLDILKQRIW